MCLDFNVLSAYPGTKPGTTQMAKVTVKRRSANERRDGKAALYIVLYLDNSKLRLPLDISVSKDDWDDDKECVRGRGKAAKDLNLIIGQAKARVNEVLVRARLRGIKLTKEEFLQDYRAPDYSEGFITYARRHLDMMKAGLRYETIRHHKIALDKVERFAPHIKLSDITPEWLRAYTKHLQTVHGNNPGTINKNIGIIRAHYYAAMRAGLVKANPFEVYRPPSPDPGIVFLTEDELNRMIDLYRNGSITDEYRLVLRFFLFMAFTAMHFTDALNLHIEQIFNGEIHYRRIKTNSQVNMPVSGPTAKLINEFRKGRSRGVLCTGIPSNQRFNYVIKKLARMAGIEKPVSAKTARHTFATLYYKKNNGDLGTLSRLLGHASITTTMIYAHIMKDNRVQGVAVFDDML